MKINIGKIKKYHKVRDHCHCTKEYGGAVHTICHLKYSVPKKMLLVFHKGSKYDYYFIRKKSAQEFKNQFTCLGENTEQCITFTIPIEEEVKATDKNGENLTKNISCIL